MSNAKRPVLYISSTKKDLEKMPSSVKQAFVQGLYEAAIGETPIDSKPLKGFGGRTVLELKDDHRGDTYRAVYTVRFKKAVYVLHVFKKKSTRGISTPKKEMDLIIARLKTAAAHYKSHYKD